MADFEKSVRASEERGIRSAIRKLTSRLSSDERYRLTANEGAVLARLANLAINHWPAPIHPGNSALSRSTGLCERTVRSITKKLCADGILLSAGNERGGSGLAVCYLVDFIEIFKKVSPLPKTENGELFLAYFSPEKHASFAGFVARKTRQVLPPVLIHATTSADAFPIKALAKVAGKTAPSQGVAPPTASVHSIAAARVKREAEKTASLGRGVEGAAL